MIGMMTLLVASSAYAGGETNCYAYGDANLLAYCVRPLPNGKGYVSSGTATVQGADTISGSGSMATYHAVKNMQPVAPTVIPAGNIYYAPYSYMPVSGYYYAQPNAVDAVAGAASSMLSAAAWAYNWRHGYVGAGGVYAASILMNYPW